jgi:hypothetical protein
LLDGRKLPEPLLEVFGKDVDATAAPHRPQSAS